MAYVLSLRYQNKDISQDHNSRDMQHHKRTDIDYTKSIPPYIHTKARDFYNEFFSQSLAEYNAKQKRADRRINNYYDYIAKDKQKNLYNEMMFKLGSMEDKLKNPQQYKKDSEIFKKICYEYVDKFRKKYPNMKVIGAYYHEDEKGADHIHIDFVPVAFNQSRGLSCQVSNEKALNQMGFKTTKESTAQMQFTAQVNKEFESLVKEKLKIKEHGKSRGYTLSNTEYKTAKENLNQMLKQDKTLLLRKQTELAKLVEIQEKIDILEEEKILKTNAIVKRKKSELVNEYIKIHKTELEDRETIKAEYAKYKKASDSWKAYGEKQEQTINENEKKISSLQAQINDFENTLSTKTKNYITERIDTATSELRAENEKLKKRNNRLKSLLDDALNFIGRTVERVIEFWRFKDKDTDYFNDPDIQIAKHMPQDQWEQLNDRIVEEHKKDQRKREETERYYRELLRQSKEKEKTPSKGDGGRSL